MLEKLPESDRVTKITLAGMCKAELLQWPKPLATARARTTPWRLRDPKSYAASISWP
ncbi:MAG: hypothetical protein KDB03_25105 [Planctomycetales bacterium]|nr:hypothetical protein [Planctomycetales bacterium]